MIEKGFRRKEISKDKFEVVNKAETVFRFLPSGFGGHNVGKFWGALYPLLVVSYTVFSCPIPWLNCPKSLSAGII